MSKLSGIESILSPIARLISEKDPVYYVINRNIIKNSNIYNAINRALNYISTICNLSFEEASTDQQKLNAVMSFGYDADLVSGAHTYSYDNKKTGSYFAQNVSIKMLTDNNSGYYTVLHEIGHALGLKHSFEFERYSSNNTVIANQTTLSPADDDTSQTIMSYTPIGSLFSTDYSVLDIAALQQKYGAKDKNIANTTYNFLTSSFDLENHLNITSINSTAYYLGQTATIVDSRGNDIFDASGYSSTVIINLTQGSTSSIGGIDNIGIAYNTAIEKAIGGSGNDILISDQNQVLQGGAGDDLLYGGSNNNTLQGGVGNDVYRVTANSSDNVIQDTDGIGSIWLGNVSVSGMATQSGSGGNTWIQNVTSNGQSVSVTYVLSQSGGQNVLNITAAGTSVTVQNYTNAGQSSLGILLRAEPGTGQTVRAGAGGNQILRATGNTSGNDLIIGGTVGGDTLYGEDGNDTLRVSASNEKLYGGNGYDQYQIGATSRNNTILDADGMGSITFVDTTASGVITLTGSAVLVGSQNISGKIINYTWNQATNNLSINTSTSAIVVQNWHNGDLDIQARINYHAIGNVTIHNDALRNEGDPQFAFPGKNLTAITSHIYDLNGLGNFNYQWTRNGVNISGATNATYTLQRLDQESDVACTVYFQDQMGFQEQVQSWNNVSVNYVNTPGLVSISGHAIQNEALVANVTDVDGINSTISYQWEYLQLNNTTGGVNSWRNIEGANQSSFTLTQEQVGKSVRVKVSYLDEHNTYELRRSTASEIVANVNDAPVGDVMLSGIAEQNQVLTADTSAIADPDELGTFSYQWQVSDGLSWANINGATAASFTLTQTLVGKRVRVLASYTDGGGTFETVTSTESGVIVNVNDSPVGNVTLSGNAAQNAALTANLNGLSDADGQPNASGFSYQWQASNGSTWSNISGATASSFNLTQAVVGRQVRVVTSYTDLQGTRETVISDTSSAVANVNDAPVGNVTLSGNATQNAVLTANLSSLSDADGLPNASGFSYQWQVSNGSSWSNVSGASASSFNLTQAQVGKQVRVVTSYTDLQGTRETVTSTASSVVTNVNDAPVGNVTLSGNATQNVVLSANLSGLSDADGLPNASGFRYQWQVGNGSTWSNISGASANNFNLTQAQVGKQVRVVTSYTDLQGTRETVTSTASRVVANVNDAPLGNVTLSGNVRQNAVLSANLSSLRDADGLPNASRFSYQWQVSNGGTWSNISGATASSFNLTQAVVGKQVRVVTSYTDLQGTRETVTSGASSVVAGVNHAPTGNVTLSGNATQNAVLTANASALTDVDGLGTFGYQWQVSNGSSWSNISGATANSFTLTQAQAGKQVRVLTNYTDGQGTAESVASAASKVVGGLFVGDSANNVLAGFAGDDTLDGGTGADTMAGGAGNDTYLVDNGADVVTEKAGEGIMDTVRTSVSYTLSNNVEALVLLGSDNINGTGNSEVNFLFGNSGNNVLDGGAGADFLNGAAGNDTFVLDNADDVIFEYANEGVDTVQSALSYTLVSNVENLQLTGTAALNATGNALDNVLTGNAGDNVLDGKAGADQLVGGAGNDTLLGGDGDDVLTGGTGADALDGGAGIDTASYVGSSAAVNASLATNGFVDLTAWLRTNRPGQLQASESTTGYGGDAAYTIDGSLSDSQWSHTFDGAHEWLKVDLGDGYAMQRVEIVNRGSGVGNRLNGATVEVLDAQGNVVGTLGTISGAYDGSMHSFAVPAGTTGRFIRINQNGQFLHVREVQVFGLPAAATGGDAQGDTLTNIENLVGSAFADTLTGDANANQLNGGAGNDTLIGCAGADVLDGGEGSDTASYAGSSTGVSVSLAASAAVDLTAWLRANRPGQLQASESTTAWGGDAAYTIDGSLSDSQWSHTLNGANEWLKVDLGDGYAMQRVEIVNRGNGVGDRLNGATVEVLDAQGYVVGTLGTISEAYDGSMHSFAVPAGTTGRFVRINQNGQFLHVREVRVFGIPPAATGGDAQGDTLTGIENLVGSAFADTLTGDANANQLSGGAGNDTLIGGAGADVLDGGEGSDTASYADSSTAVSVSLASSETIDLTAWLRTNRPGQLQASESTTGYGGDAAYTIDGSLSDSQWSCTFDGANEWLKVDLGDGYAMQRVEIVNRGNGVGDRLNGATVEVLDAQGNVVGTLGTISGAYDGSMHSFAVPAGTTGRYVRINHSGQYLHVREVRVFGLPAAATGGDAQGDTLTNIENLVGSAFADTLAGDANANQLNGGAGNDTLIGDAGADVLDGGAGSDTVSYAGSSAGVSVSLAASASVDLTAWLRTNRPGQLQASESTTGYGGDAAYTIDGSLSDSQWSHTFDGANEWLKVDLGDGYAMQRVEIVNRGSGVGNRLNGATVEVLDAQGNVVGTLGSISGAYDGSMHSFAVPAGTTGRFVRINQNGQFLHVREVRVFGIPPAATGGDAQGDTLTGIENLVGSAFADTLTGDANANQLSGGAGNDTLIGGAGNDTYLFGNGDGADTLVENDATAGNTDVLQTGAGIDVSQLWFKQDGNNLEVSVIGTSDKMTLQNWYLGNQYHVEQFKTADGRTLSDSSVANLVQAMASFTPPSAGQTTLPPNYQTTLAPVLAANWH